MTEVDDTNISADLARVLNNNRHALKLNSKFSIIGIQIALKDAAITSTDIVNKDAVVGLMAGMIASASEHSDIDLSAKHNNVLKAMQKTAVIIAKDPTNAKLGQGEAMIMGKKLIAKSMNNILSKGKGTVDYITNMLVIASGVNKGFDKIVSPELKQKLYKALNQDVKKTQTTPDYTLTPEKGGRTL